ncbi:MAG: cobyrinate a,c-diamide synthase [Synergistaceae bacterium]|nr:cobyrinate a,c-diamide synthase [Synergistaceae bacterium]
MREFSGTKGFVLAAASSGSGKTTIASAVCGVMREAGMTVQPFKVGPDFIDPTYLSLASGRTCRNLDGFPCPELMPYFYREQCLDGTKADIAVVEGVMGLYDGLGADGIYSTAWLARKLGLPVILIVDARAAATSVAATVKGFATLEPLAPDVAGVIANRVSGERHARLIGEAVQRFADIPMVGWVPHMAECAFPSRRLGLIPAGERDTTRGAMERFTQALRERLDTQALTRIARAPSGEYAEPEFPAPAAKDGGSPVRVAVADDDAFCFHYRENWRMMERLGAEMTSVSPLRDHRVPDKTDLLILPGGYPEEFREELMGNKNFTQSVRDFANRGCVYAECGGMVYLCRNFVDLIDADAVMTERLSRFGYVEGRALTDNLIMKRGETVRAHEFHYSKLEGTPPGAFSVRKFSRPEEEWTDGHSMNGGRLLATYLHINFYSRPESARMMLQQAAGLRP